MRIHARVVELATCNLCVYAAGARIFRYWSRYTQVGAYTRKCNGCVPRTYAGVGIVRSGKFARGPSTDRVRSTRRQADTRPTPAAAHDAVHDASTDPHRTHPKGSGMPCGRYTARTREEGRSHSPEPSRNGLKPPSASRPTVRHAFCAQPHALHDALLGRSVRTTAQSNKSTVLTAITRGGAPHDVFYGGRPRSRGSCRKRPGASAACSRTSYLEPISSRLSR